jgi:predicted nucleic acid-binding protein
MPDDLAPRSPLVVDASVGLKWVVEESGSDDAAALLDGRKLLTSALFWAEAANALASKLRRNELDRAAAMDAWLDLSRAPVETEALTADAVGRALHLAADLGHPIYDCCYLALALERGAVVVTADRRFVDAVGRHPYLARHVRVLRG